MASKRRVSSAQDNSVKKLLREYMEALLIAFSIALLVRTFLFSAYKMPSDVMFPNLTVGDFILGSKLSYGLKLPLMGDRRFFSSEPQRGDLVIFKCPSQPDLDCVRRVVGLPGDRIQLVKKNLIVNNIPSVYSSSGIKDSGRVLLFERTPDSERLIAISSSLDRESHGPMVVPPGQVFVLGDSRDESEDSRTWGTLPVNSLKGKALFIWLSLNWEPVWKNEGSAQLRWDRMFAKIK